MKSMQSLQMQTILKNFKNKLMKQYTRKEFITILKKNGFYYDRHKGSHSIFINDKGRHISVPYNLECVIAQRLLKENNLDINLRKK